MTPTSQIVGTQAVINVLTGERYKSITKEAAGVLKGEYGATPASVNAELQARVLEGGQAITCRPADLLQDELDHLTKELLEKAQVEKITLADAKVDDVLTYALFPQVGLKFLKNRHNPEAFEPAPGKEPAPVATAPASAKPAAGIESYSVKVDGVVYDVEVGPQGQLTSVVPAGQKAAPKPTVATTTQGAEAVAAPLAGTIFKIQVEQGDEVAEGDVLIVLEAMKMETEIRAARSGVIQELHVKEGDSVRVGASLLSLA